MHLPGGVEDEHVEVVHTVLVGSVLRGTGLHAALLGPEVQHYTCGKPLCHAGTLLEQRVLGTRVQSYRQQHGRQQGQYVFMSCSHNSNDMQFRLIERGNGYLFRIPVLYFKF